MRLLKISLENWRGIEKREISLANDITLIEGPNEVGKSTFVEAIRMLFKDMDSSNRRDVKAIQPIGMDVGSRIEAEFEVGDYHLVYSKTYNRSKQTTLKILSPSPKQLTGREAHEMVEQILEDNIDLALWDALLVDQGAEVALVNLQDSKSLANALDEAAGSYSGSSSSGDSAVFDRNEESNLYLAVQAEYERHYTLKTGKEKFSGLVTDYQQAEHRLEEAKSALAAVENNQFEYEQCLANVLRLKAELPTISNNLEKLKANLNRLNNLSEMIRQSEVQLSSAQEIFSTAEHLWKTRQELIEEISREQQTLDIKQKGQLPLRAERDEIKQQADRVRLIIAELKRKHASAKVAFESAQQDDVFLQSQEQLAIERKRIKQLAEISRTIVPFLETTNSNIIDQTVLDLFREAESRLLIARTKYDAAATTVTVTAFLPLTVEINDETIKLDNADSETYLVSSEVNLKIENVADLCITPPQSATDTQEEAEAARSNLIDLSNRYGVADYPAAHAAYENRRHALQELNRLRARESEILRESTPSEIQRTINSLQSNGDQYVAKRKATTPLPRSSSDARAMLTEAHNIFLAQQIDLESSRDDLESLERKFNEFDDRLRTDEQELAGLRAALTDKLRRLESDEAHVAAPLLQERAEQARQNLSALAAELRLQKAKFAEFSPDALRARLSNAEDVHTRTQLDIRHEEQRLAVLKDRLHSARADGRFELLDTSERDLEYCREALYATRQRAEAAALLWSTMTTYREAAREAYVRPLKDAIEKLGTIVFNSGFEVTINDDWSIFSRTLNDKTVAFDDLSVGAKEQLGILTRLAAAQLVSKNGGVPLIIDDALGFSDPQRLETMGAAIAAAGKQCQIIILTCTPGRFLHVGNATVVKFGAS